MVALLSSLWTPRLTRSSHARRIACLAVLAAMLWFPAPSPAVAATSAIAIATGNGFSCALKDDGAVWCWGADFEATSVMERPAMTTTCA